MVCSSEAPVNGPESPRKPGEAAEAIFG